jgi:hypothetical protein
VSYFVSGVALTVILALFLWWWVGRLRRSWQDEAAWVRAAEKTARESGIASRPDITVHLAKHLRRQNLIQELANLVLIFLLVSIDPIGSALDRRPDPARLVESLVAIPWLLVVVGVIVALPAWSEARQRRVAHLNAARLRDSFTLGEWRVLGAGATVGVVAAYWALVRSSASGAWWLVWLASLAVYALTSWWAMRVVLRRPAHASDDLELAWDDMLRHGQLRAVTLIAVWVPTALAVMIWCAFIFPAGNLLPLYGLAAAGYLLFRFFKRGDQLWRRAWKPA